MREKTYDGDYSLQSQKGVMYHAYPSVCGKYGNISLSMVPNVGVWSVLQYEYIPGT